MDVGDNRLRNIDPDLNLTRIMFFIVGVMTGVALTVMLYTRPQSTYRKQYFNDCGRGPDMVSRCGHGSPDMNPSD